RRWFEFTGTSLEEAEGRGWMRFLHPDDRGRTVERWKHSLRTGERYSIEYRFRNVRGEYCWFWGQALPQRNENGEIVGWFGTLTDISDRKRLRSEEHTSELQSRENLVYRLLLEKKTVSVWFTHTTYLNTKSNIS